MRGTTNRVGRTMRGFSDRELILSTGNQDKWTSHIRLQRRLIWLQQMWARAKKSLESESGIDSTINQEKAEMFKLKFNVNLIV